MVVFCAILLRSLRLWGEEERVALIRRTPGWCRALASLSRPLRPNEAVVFSDVARKIFNQQRHPRIAVFVQLSAGRFLPVPVSECHVRPASHLDGAACVTGCVCVCVCEGRDLDPDFALPLKDMPNPGGAADDSDVSRCVSSRAGGWKLRMSDSICCFSGIHYVFLKVFPTICIKAH